MTTRGTLRQTLLGRDVAVAYTIIIALYFVSAVRFQPFQLPAYLLIVTYDAVEIALPILTPYYPVGFPLFLYLLAIVGAGAARWLQFGDEDEPALTRAAGGVCLVVGSLSLLFAGFIGGPLVSSTDNPTPLAITGVTGILFLVGGWLLLGRPSVRERSPVSNGR